jgi:hypothetical protein
VRRCRGKIDINRFNQRFSACVQGVDANSNPYPIDTQSGREWQRGFSAAVEYFTELRALEKIFKQRRTKIRK